MARNSGNNDLHEHAFQEYLRAISLPPGHWNLFQLSLHIATTCSPGLDFSPHWEQLQQIQSQVAAQMSGQADVFEVIESINFVLFRELGFRGNREDYYNPDNSFMDRVLENRLGIPITLSILYREIAAGVGLRLDCVSLPGHFLLSFRNRGNQLFLDAFGSGAVLVQEDCRAIVEELYQGKIAFSAAMLEPTTPDQVVLRMLGNLRQIYRRQGKSEYLLRILNRRIPLLEDPLRDILERGLVNLDLHYYRHALSDFETFVDKTTDRRMKDLIRQQIDKLKILAAGN